MNFFVHCRRCGHSNQPDATTCAVCQRPLVIGIQNGMHCPVCGALSSAGTDVCARCHTNLVEVEKIPEAKRTLDCGYCHRSNPPFSPDDAAVYCVHCGHQLRLPGADYSVAYLSPRGAMAKPNPKGNQTLSLPLDRLDYVILFGLGLAGLVLPGLPPIARTAVMLLFWLGVPLALVMIRAFARLPFWAGNRRGQTNVDRSGRERPVESKSARD